MHPALMQTGNKVATLTMQVIAAEVGAVQTSQLLCITDGAKKKTYTVGEQSIGNGSDPLLVAIENWRQSTDVVVKGLIAEVTDFIAGNINSVSFLDRPVWDEGIRTSH